MEVLAQRGGREVNIAPKEKKGNIIKQTTLYQDIKGQVFENYNEAEFSNFKKLCIERLDKYHQEWNKQQQPDDTMVITATSASSAALAFAWFIQFYNINLDYYQLYKDYKKMIKNIEKLEVVYPTLFIMGQRDEQDWFIKTFSNFIKDKLEELKSLEFYVEKILRRDEREKIEKEFTQYILKTNQLQKIFNVVEEALNETANKS